MMKKDKSGGNVEAQFQANFPNTPYVKGTYYSAWNVQKRAENAGNLIEDLVRAGCIEIGTWSELKRHLGQSQSDTDHVSQRWCAGLEEVE